MFFNDIIAIFALIVSRISLYKSNQNTRESNRISRDNKIQERILDIEQARETDRINQSSKAKLVTKIIGDDPRYLRIENLGLAGARKVEVLTNEKPLLEHPRINKYSFPKIDYISPDHHIDYSLFKSQGATTQEVCVSWEDDAGSNSIRATLNF